MIDRKQNKLRWRVKKKENKLWVGKGLEWLRFVFVSHFAWLPCIVCCLMPFCMVHCRIYLFQIQNDCPATLDFMKAHIFIASYTFPKPKKNGISHPMGWPQKINSRLNTVFHPFPSFDNTLFALSLPCTLCGRVCVGAWDCVRSLLREKHRERK